MSRVEGNCAGRDACALTWHVAHTAVPRDTSSTPSFAVPTSTASAKACAHLCDATHFSPRIVVVPYAWIALFVAFAAVPIRTDSAFMQLTCRRTVLCIEFINSVLAQLHDLHCFAEPFHSHE
eukprot:3602720-Pleurochrysis_carterae.AAC.1